MADYNYGRGTSDYTFEIVGDQQIMRGDTAITFYDAEAGGSQITGLKSVDGDPLDADTVVSDSNGALPRFKAPVTSMWADGGLGRFLIQSTDLADLVAGSIGQDGGTVDTLAVTNDLTVGGSLTAASLNLADVTVTGADETNRSVSFKTDAVARWQVAADDSAEAGSAVGSDLVVQRYNDAGTAVSIPLKIERDTGYVGINAATPGAQLQVESDGTVPAILAKATAGGTATVAAIGGIVPSTAKRLLDLRVTGDTYPRIKADFSGGSSRSTVGFSVDGINPGPKFYAETANELHTSGDLVVDGKLSATGGLTLTTAMLADIRTTVNVFDVRNYGAKGDAKRRNQASAASSASTSVTVPGAGFTSADIGKTFVAFSSSDVGDIRTITSVTSSTVVVLSGQVGIGVNGNVRHMAVWGTDDSNAIQNAYTAAGAAASYNADAQDNLPVVSANPVVTFPAINEGAYLIAGSLTVTVPNGVASDMEGVAFYGCLSGRTTPLFTFGRHTVTPMICAYLLLGGGLYVGTDSDQCHSQFGLVEVWNPNTAVYGLELHGYHHKIEQFWVKALGVGGGIYHNGSSDDYIGHAYMVGPAIGAKLNGCNNVVYNHLRGDTVTTTALLQIDDSRTVNIKGHAFVITSGTLPRVIQIGANSTVVSASINVEMQVTKTGGNIMEIAYCSNSWFRFYASNSDGGAGFGQLITNGIVYGTGVAAPVTIEQYLPSTGVTAYTGTRVGTNVTYMGGKIDWNNGQMTLDETNGRLQINGSTAATRLGVTTTGTANHGVWAETSTASTTTFPVYHANLGLSTNKAFEATIGAESTARFAVLGNGQHEWGDGTGARDVTLYRSAADTLKTDDTFNAVGGLQANGISVAPLFARKTSDTAITSNTTLTADSDLVLSLLAGATYLFEAFLIADGLGDATTTGDLKIDFNFSSAPTACNWTAYGPSTSSASSSSSVVQSVNNASGSSSVGTFTVGNKIAARPGGIVRTNAATTITMRFAQVGSSATATTVYTDSWLRATRVA